MMHQFLLVSVIIYHTKLTNSRDLFCALSINYKNNYVLIKLRPGRNGEFLGSVWGDDMWRLYEER